MRLYGQRKRHMRIHGHGHKRYICKPKIDKKTGRRKAREQNKKDGDLNGEMDDIFYK